MLLQIHEDGKHCWVTDVCNTLCKHGFGFVWHNQGVQNVNMFLKVYKQRLVDCYRQDWQSHLDRSDRFSVYRTIKLVHHIESYFDCVPSNGLRKALIRFRLGISELRTHKFRYCSEDVHLDCQLCGCSLDNEMHFLFYCDNLSALREKFIPSRYCRFPSLDKMCSLFNDRENLNNLARFIYHSLKLRKS